MTVTQSRYFILNNKYTDSTTPSSIKILLGRLEHAQPKYKRPNHNKHLLLSMQIFVTSGVQTRLLTQQPIAINPMLKFILKKCIYTLLCTDQHIVALALYIHIRVPLYWALYCTSDFHGNTVVIVNATMSSSCVITKLYILSTNIL